MGNQLTAQSIHSRHMSKVMEAMAGVQGFIDDSPWSRLREEPDVCDFALGNPHDDPLPGLTQAFQRWSVPENKDWFAYKMSEPGPRELVAHSLRLRLGVPFEADDIFMTNGAFAALSVAVGAITDPGDEIIYVSPPWFFYAPIIVSHNGTPVRVPCDPHSFDLDLNAIRGAITPHTRAVIVNTPNNPTGRIYPPDTLKSLAALLNEASEAAGRPIYLLSDESYSHLLYDGHAFHSPAEYYPNTFLIYTYGKTLLAPGQRIGYIALPASMPVREQLRPVIFATQMVTGYAFPNALLQHALPDLENLTIDIERLQARRDHLVKALRKIGYKLNPPEATFYVLARSPLEDDQAFIDMLGEEKILCLPGSVFEMPGFFRISLTATDEMVERALPGFARAFTRAKVESKEILETNMHQ